MTLSDAEIMAMVLAAFQEEQAEHCQAIGDILLDLERDPQTPQRKALLDQLFREAHSLKGGARAAGLEAVEQLAHRVEDVFSAVRQGNIELTPEVCDPIYASLDALGTMMSRVAANQEITIEPYAALLETFARILGEEPSVPATPAEDATSTTPAALAEPTEPAAPAAPADLAPSTAPVELAQPEEPAPPAATAMPNQPASLPAESGNSKPAPQPPAAPAASTNGSEEVPWETATTTVRLSTAALDNLLNETGELITCAVRAQQRARNAHQLGDPALRWRRIWRQTRPILKKIQESLPEFQPTVHHLEKPEEGFQIRQNGNRTLWYDQSSHPMLQSQVTTLINTLIQANDIITHLDRDLGVHAREMAEDYSRLAAVTDRMHDQIRRTRMLPLTTLFSPLRLQMREMMRTASKEVHLSLDDGGAEADRQVLERLREVLLHLIRNAIDHGIEPADVRVANGKPPIGQVALRAAVSGDYLYLSVEDDGSGLDLNVICQRALEQGLINETEMLRLSEAELIDLIFSAGFSTRTTVSKLSGRGVGLDIVRSQVERMHGRVTVQSTPGVGSTFIISVPLSLTSSHGLLLRVGAATYMISLESVQRIVSVTPRDIQIVEGRAALIIDNRPVALMHLADLLGEVKASQWQEPGSDQRSAQHNTSLSGNGRSLALLLGSGERQVACMVDAIQGEQELVVHRLPAPIHRLRFIAGATILADGSVVPILDLVDLMRAAIGSRRLINMQVEEHSSEHRPTVLVVDDSITTRTLEKNILEAAGYQVHLATDGLEALHVLEQLSDNGGCDLLLSDVDMPRLNGFDLTSQVRTHTELKHLPIVLVTSLDKPSDRERGISAGADAYIIKRSFDQQILLDTIAQLI